MDNTGLAGEILEAKVRASLAKAKADSWDDDNSLYTAYGHIEYMHKAAMVLISAAMDAVSWQNDGKWIALQDVLEVGCDAHEAIGVRDMPSLRRVLVAFIEATYGVEERKREHEKNRARAT